MALNSNVFLAFLMVTFIFSHRVSKQKQEASMGELLSMGYHREWLKEQTERKQARENKKVNISLI